MLIKMLKGACACNDGVHSTWYKKDQEVISPEEITDENAQIFVENNIATLISEGIAPPLNKAFIPGETKGEGEDEDCEIIDIDDEDEEDELSDAPELVKELTNKPLFSRNKKRK